jgi:hypothetical protein
MGDFKPINNQQNNYQQNNYQQNNNNQNNYKQIQRFNFNDKQEDKQEDKEEDKLESKLESKFEAKSEDKQYKDDDKKTKYINDTNEDVFAVLDMKQTDNPDVYKLYCV